MEVEIPTDVDNYEVKSGRRVYVAIRRAPVQKDVWRVAKRIAIELAKQYPDQITAEYRVAHRPEGRVLVDYNQNAWGRTLASIYSLRPRPEATVSAPVTWEEVNAGISISDFTMSNMLERIDKVGDLFKPVLQQRSRCSIEALA